ncbi:MAG TPA: hypothetical protein VNP02_08140 [Gammaproteobacteria bacterium]|nr:hypothetical protein [Gammaproteobacteria bacterium]
MPPIKQLIHAPLLGVAILALAACSARDGSPSSTQASAFNYPDGSPHPVTPWGDPDLQGNWPIMHLFATRLQRDPKFGDRRELNDDEWQTAEAGLKARDARYQDEIKTNKMGMGHWAETTTRTEAARLTSLISYPLDGQLPALTARGDDLAPTFRSDDTETVFDSVNDFDAWDRCITRGLPASMLPFNYNNGIRIHQAPGYVVIDLEMIHEARVVPLNLPPLDPAIKEWMGESRGHWDGASLVVETTNFTGKAPMLIAGIPGGVRGPRPSTVNMRTTERFTRVSADRIDYEMTIEDPEIQADKWTISYPMFLDPEYQFYEYACHEDNTAVRNFITTSQYERGLRGKAN